MRSKHTKNYGGAGVDTQYERDYINYKPKIEYNPEKLYEKYQLDEKDIAGGYLTEIVTSNIADALNESVVAIERIRNIEVKMSELLKDYIAYVELDDEIRKAARNLGFETLTDGIPFALYKESFNHPLSIDAYTIQEAFERYTSDVNGNLLAEMYADVAEISNDWASMENFIKVGLLAQLTDVNKLPKELTTDGSEILAIREIERQLTEQYAGELKIKSVSQEAYLTLAKTKYGSNEYYTAVAEYDSSKRRLMNLEKKLFTKTEIVDLIERKASDTNEALDFIEQVFDYQAFGDEKYDILYNVLRQYDSKTDAVEGLSKINVLLKLSVDGKNDTTNEMKNTLRGLAGYENKSKINQNLINGVHLRNEVFTSVYDTLKNIDGVPNAGSFGSILNHISDGVNEAEKRYQLQLSDFYKVHTMDSELRNNKMVSVIDKDAARSTYKIVSEVIAYMNEENRSYPNPAKLSTWLTEFMEQAKK